MKTLSAYNQTAIDNPNVSPIRLLKIEFTGLTLYMCDRKFGDSGSEFVFNSQIYEPMILNWGDIRYGEIGQFSRKGTPGDFSFTVDNTIPVGGGNSFTSLFNTYRISFAKVTVYDTYEGASVAGDLVTRFVGTVEDIDMSLENVVVHCTSYEISVINKVSFNYVTQDSYSYADPDEFGKILPIVYGEAKRVPFRSVDAGSVSTLVDGIDASQVYVNVSDASSFPVGGGTIQIDYEEITYSYVTGNQFAGCTRGANGTDALTHQEGTTVAEIQSQYFYIIDHPVKSIDAVYVIHRDSGDNILQSPTIYTLYTGQTGDEHASYPGKAVIRFNTIPVIGAQINITPVDTIDVVDTTDVDDTIDVSDTTDVDEGSHAHGGDTYDIWHMEYGTVLSGFVDDGTYDQRSSVHNASNGDIGNYASLYHPPTTLQIQKIYTEQGQGTPSYYRVCMAISWSDSMVRCKFTWNSHYVQSSIAGTGIFKSSWYSTTLTWALINNIKGTIEVINAGSTAGVITVRDAWIEFIRSETVEGPATGVEKVAVASKVGAAVKDGTVVKIGTVELIGNSVADTVIGGKVSADVQGWRADASGDYGTENSLIQRPDYVFKHFLVNYCGLTIADNINEAVYNASGTGYITDAINLSVVLMERPDLLDLLESMAVQAKSYQFWESGQHYLLRASSAEVTDKIIEEGRIDISSVKVAYTPRADLLNRYTANFGKEWVGDYESNVESYKSVIQLGSSESVTVYGTLENEPMDFPFIRSSDQAGKIVDWYLDNSKFQRLIIQFSGGHWFSDLERGDIVEFIFDSGSALDKQLLGLVVSESDQFRVTDIVEDETGTFHITVYKYVPLANNSDIFYPAVTGDDGYVENSVFHSGTYFLPIGSAVNSFTTEYIWDGDAKYGYYGFYLCTVLTYDSNGFLHTSFGSWGGSKTFYLTNASGAWTDEVIVSEVGFSPGVVLEDDNPISLINRSSFTPDRITAYEKNGSWTATLIDGTSTVQFYFPAVSFIQDSSKNTHLATVATGSQIRYYEKAYGGNWSGENVSSPYMTCKGVSILEDEGDIYIFECGNYAAIRWHSNAGGSWAVSTNSSLPTSGNISWVESFFDSSGRIVLAFASTTWLGVIRYDGSWSTVFALEFSSTAADCMAASMDSNNSIHLFCNASSVTYYYIIDSDGSYTVENLNQTEGLIYEIVTPQFAAPRYSTEAINAFIAPSQKWIFLFSRPL